MKTILVADDEYVSQRIIELILGKKNFQVLFASNGFEAMQRMSEHPVDLLITDINMPYMDGISLLDFVRSGERYRSLPIVVMTASPLPEIPKQVADKGATGFLYQPFSSYELLSLVNQQFESQVQQ